MTGLAMAPEALVERARGGDRRALDRLLAVCRPNLERYARRHCQSDDVEEAIQDALWILHRKLHGLRSVAAFAGWLFRVVRRACQALARGRRRHAPLDAALADSRATDPELRVAIASAIAGLAPAYREVLLLRDVQGLSAEETAARLGVSVEAAKSRLHRARAIVRQDLAAQ